MSDAAKPQQVRINERIRIPQIRLIDENGEQVGLIETRTALQMARDKGLDLVEVASTARPPVCKIMDYGRFKYEQTKKNKQSKKKQHQVEVRELQFRPTTDTHDYETKKRKLFEFIEDGDKVKVQVIYRGREVVHQELGNELMRQLVEDVKEVAAPESKPKMEGRALLAIFIPTRHKDKKDDKADE